MRRLIPVLLFCGLANACAVVDMPGGPGTQTEWMDERVADGAEAREAPAAVPSQRLDRATERAINSGIDEVLEDRASLNQQVEAQEPAPEIGVDEFLADAHERATPPE